MSTYSFLNPGSSYRLPRSFDYECYIEAEREFWALFPETDGKRVNFCQTGLTAQLFVEAAEDGSELQGDETYFLMPCADGAMRPVRMRVARRLTRDEYRMVHLTGLKLMECMRPTRDIFATVHMEVMGPEIAGED